MRGISGKCGLCLEEQVELTHSHGIPAGVYRLFSEDGPLSSNTLEGVKPVTRQDQQYLLCRRCEGRFAEAENWVLRRAPRKGRFRFGELATSHQTDLHFPGARVILAENRPLVNVELLVRFSLSIFWRYSFDGWLSGTRVTLGPFSERIREHLLGGPFPNDICVLLFLKPATLEHHVLSLPNTTRAKGFRLHQFGMPGFDFLLAAGQQIPSSMRKFCLATASGHPLMSSQRHNALRLDQMIRGLEAAENAKPIPEWNRTGAWRRTV